MCIFYVFDCICFLSVLNCQKGAHLYKCIIISLAVVPKTRPVGTSAASSYASMQPMWCICSRCATMYTEFTMFLCFFYGTFKVPEKVPCLLHLTEWADEDQRLIRRICSIFLHFSAYEANKVTFPSSCEELSLRAADKQTDCGVQIWVVSDFIYSHIWIHAPPEFTCTSSQLAPQNKKADGVHMAWLPVSPSNTLHFSFCGTSLGCFCRVFFFFFFLWPCSFT